MSNEVIKILDALCKKIGLSINWAQENIVPYFQQLTEKYVNYELATSWAWLLLGIIASTIFVYAIFKGFIFCTDSKYCYDDFPTIIGCVMILFGSVFLVLCVLCIVTQIFDIITCYTFPEKIILEELIEIKKQIG